MWYLYIDHFELRAVIRYLNGNGFPPQLNPAAKNRIKHFSANFYVVNDNLHLKDYTQNSNLCKILIIKPNSRCCTVGWSESSIDSRKVDFVRINIFEKITRDVNNEKKNKEYVHKAPFDQGFYSMSYLEGGKTYFVNVQLIQEVILEHAGNKKVYNFILSEKSENFQSVLSLRELEQLFDRSRKYAGSDPGQDILYMYRNKPQTYWDDIKNVHEGIMKPYMKDYNGDPGCPINGKIEGLFFAARRDNKNGALPQKSPFGDVRLIIPVERIFNPMMNLYFADFYCVNSIHYSTVVLTYTGTAVDFFCSQNLRLLRVDDNPFFMCTWMPGVPGLTAGSYQYKMAKKLHVEVFYTEPVNVALELNLTSDCRFYRVETQGRGSSTLLGLIKNTNCNICNLYQTKRKRDESVDVNQNKKQRLSKNKSVVKKTNGDKISPTSQSSEKLAATKDTVRPVLKAKRHLPVTTTTAVTSAPTTVGQPSVTIHNVTVSKASVSASIAAVEKAAETAVNTSVGKTIVTATVGKPTVPTAKSESATIKKSAQVKSTPSSKEAALLKAKTHLDTVTASKTVVRVNSAAFEKVKTVTTEKLQEKCEGSLQKTQVTKFDKTITQNIDGKICASQETKMTKIDDASMKIAVESAVLLQTNAAVLEINAEGKNSVVAAVTDRNDNYSECKETADTVQSNGLDVNDDTMHDAIECKETAQTVESNGLDEKNNTMHDAIECKETAKTIQSNGLAIDNNANNIFKAINKAEKEILEDDYANISIDIDQFQVLDSLSDSDMSFNGTYKVINIGELDSEEPELEICEKQVENTDALNNNFILKDVLNSVFGNDVSLLEGKEDDDMAEYKTSADNINKPSVIVDNDIEMIDKNPDEGTEAALEPRAVEKKNNPGTVIAESVNVLIGIHESKIDDLENDYLSDDGLLSDDLLGINSDSDSDVESIDSELERTLLASPVPQFEGDGNDTTPVEGLHYHVPQVEEHGIDTTTVKGSNSESDTQKKETAEKCCSIDLSFPLKDEVMDIDDLLQLMDEHSNTSSNNSNHLQLLEGKSMQSQCSELNSVNVISSDDKKTSANFLSEIPDSIFSDKTGNGSCKTPFDKDLQCSGETSAETKMSKETNVSISAIVDKSMSTSLPGVLKKRIKSNISNTGQCIADSFSCKTPTLSSDRSCTLSMSSDSSCTLSMQGTKSHLNEKGRSLSYFSRNSSVINSGDDNKIAPVQFTKILNPITKAVHSPDELPKKVKHAFEKLPEKAKPIRNSVESVSCIEMSKEVKRSHELIESVYRIDSPILPKLPDKCVQSTFASPLNLKEQNSSAKQPAKSCHFSPVLDVRNFTFVLPQRLTKLSDDCGVKTPSYNISTSIHVPVSSDKNDKMCESRKRLKYSCLPQSQVCTSNGDDLLEKLIDGPKIQASKSKANENAKKLGKIHSDSVYIQNVKQYEVIDLTCDLESEVERSAEISTDGLKPRNNFKSRVLHGDSDRIIPKIEKSKASNPEKMNTLSLHMPKRTSNSSDFNSASIVRKSDCKKEEIKPLKYCTSKQGAPSKYLKALSYQHINIRKNLTPSKSIENVRKWSPQYEVIAQQDQTSFTEIKKKVNTRKKTVDKLSLYNPPLVKSSDNEELEEGELPPSPFQLIAGSKLPISKNENLMKTVLLKTMSHTPVNTDDPKRLADAKLVVQKKDLSTASSSFCKNQKIIKCNPTEKLKSTNSSIESDNGTSAFAEYKKHSDMGLSAPCMNIVRKSQEGKTPQGVNPVIQSQFCQKISGVLNKSKKKKKKQVSRGCDLSGTSKYSDFSYDDILKEAEDDVKRRHSSETGVLGSSYVGDRLRHKSAF